ncbi:MAG: glycosyltransferase [Edaphobacter sp.]|uniref:glycosyltransferase n=1 Tax=Edaphobacter sp. TaxID=1934404 RepID=UPI00238979ED|nr:glycosyltransferase [Edaphobacter sp.]MDE1175185.1 glycosyltransferase [Edaphobacter sp.]
MKTELQAGKPLKVSVVVIGRNEGERLRRCLSSVFAMDRTGFETEVIYVDSGSTDGSTELARSMGAQAIVLKPERPSAALGRNAGWRAAVGDIVLFLDGDTVLHPRFVVDSLSEFQNQEVAVVWGHRRELYPKSSIYIRTLDLDWVYAPGWTLYCGGDALFLREVLAKVEGFDETLIAGEEPELCRRISSLGFRILHVDRPMTGHDLAIHHWRQYWKRSARAGHAYAEVSERYRDTEQAFWTGESKRNRNRAIMWSGITVISAITALWIHHLWPIGILVFFMAAGALRSAWKARWKSNDTIALALYGVHSHLQQIPIFVGQMQYWINHRRGKRAMLVEYKQS